MYKFISLKTDKEIEIIFNSENVEKTIMESINIDIKDIFFKIILR
jgi:hypothetical protein